MANPIVCLFRVQEQYLGASTRSTVPVDYVGQHSLQGRLLGGDHDREVHVIPRIILISVEGELPFTLTRRQFPVQLCFAMTINKSRANHWTQWGWI